MTGVLVTGRLGEQTAAGLLAERLRTVAGAVPDESDLLRTVVERHAWLLGAEARA
jgi:hypothetical protein